MLVMPRRPSTPIQPGEPYVVYGGTRMRPETAEHMRAYSSARSRALSRLRKAHEAEFQRLLAEELGR